MFMRIHAFPLLSPLSAESIFLPLSPPPPPLRVPRLSQVAVARPVATHRRRRLAVPVTDLLSPPPPLPPAAAASDHRHSICLEEQKRRKRWDYYETLLWFNKTGGS
ncbi:hypothetical protein MANES_14G154101v8 [Manihot esculenta]|uniref:Uncharacterized protein n=5 Tax=Manihot esculenta TaxID=3983 RepID=A0ACB7GJ76_MANES|nr:hypothetical protein MANES_14G154101v8 [Manihot esculenta]KAG8639541.1 hypothetical protein MANES_14G154101v8 [Manihot esculenta]KAG8639542.1 hypothetical protein MANES_14G154101v8 [Manihot esculenta]KAG8639543.1 hypothetical protein MANES_14G154101v8 [Manihot esculenta]KAG8639544.1 hypothetical protein MANES_14G154101v8 [Manihot esculenta]